MSDTQAKLAYIEKINTANNRLMSLRSMSSDVLFAGRQGNPGMKLFSMDSSGSGIVVDEVVRDLLMKSFDTAILDADKELEKLLEKVVL